MTKSVIMFHFVCTCYFVLKNDISFFFFFFLYGVGVFYDCLPVVVFMFNFIIDKL